MRHWPNALLALLAVTGCQGSYTLRERDELEGDDPGECADGADNDADDQFDCDDEDCANAPDCQGCADADADAVCDEVDVCPGADDGLDGDGDGVADGCDACPVDPADDSDGDGTCDSDDTCPDANDAADADADGVPNACDPCPADAPDDSDGDGSCDSDDSCPGADDAVDADADGVPDACDPCPADDPDDSDADGVCDSDDACQGSDDALDADNDGIPDGCDVYTPPVGGTALRFDGVDDYVEIPYDASMDTPPTGLTIEAWVYYDQIAANCMTVLRRGQSASASQEYWLHKNMGPADSLHWAGWASWTVTGWAAVAPGGWYHYAGTWDPAGDAAIWLNGTLWASAAAGGPPTTVYEATRIGIDWDLGCGMDGVIDEVRISSVVRYTAPFAPAADLTSDADTMALWNFDEGAGTTAADSSGNGNHGTIWGAAWTNEQPP